MSLGSVLKPALPGKNVWLIKSTLLGKKFSTMHTVNYHSEKMLWQGICTEILVFHNITGSNPMLSLFFKS